MTPTSVQAEMAPIYARLAFLRIFLWIIEEFTNDMFCHFREIPVVRWFAKKKMDVFTLLVLQSGKARGVLHLTPGFSQEFRVLMRG